VNVSKDSIPYNPSISAFIGELFLEDMFVDELTGAEKSQIKV